MATTTIPWGDGSGDNIYLTYSSASGNQTVTVSSDAHTAYIERSQDIIFSATANGMTVTATLTVTQSGKNITIITRNDTAFTRNDVAVGYE